MPNGGTLTIFLQSTLVGPHSDEQLVPGMYQRMSITDTGVGMDADTLLRAVEPFFSTKETGRGTGLGLSMVHGLAAQLGGCFHLESAPGKGTQADLWLPVASAPATSPRSNPVALRIEMSPLSVLLVDDEELVREGTAAMLRELGHEVTEAHGGAEALARMARSDCFDIVITDYKMPRMDGAELALRLRETRPAMPVLLITGYTGLTEDAPGLPALPKPFRQHDLARAIAQLVDPPSLTG